MLSQIFSYEKLLLEWNEKINLISRKDTENFIYRHVLPCLCINRVCGFKKNSSIADVGTGGGLPGIPLAITNPTIKFTLIDSIGKKIAAVSDIISALNLANVVTKNARAEDVGEKFDYIVARAVANFPTFLKNIETMRNKETKIFYIKGIDCEEELHCVGSYNIHNVGTLLDDVNFKDKVIVEIF